MRTKKTILNSISSLFLQMVTAICGFVLPRMILVAFGSEVNGAVSSITQFLGYISMLEAGVGGVARAALYKPLVDRDYTQISAIVNATDKFFRKIGLLFSVYAILISVLYTFISSTTLDWLFTFFLVIIISISMFFQYFFGMTSTIVLRSDQKSYIPNLINILTIILNTFVSVLLIKIGANILIVKLFSSLIFIIRPLFTYLYVHKAYNIDSSIPVDNLSIKQRWNALGHHIAFFLYNNTDIMIVTLFLGLKKVSVYAVYSMIIVGIKSIVNAISGGTESALGNIIAKSENEILKECFSMIETCVSIVVIVCFVTTGVVLIDFIDIYTANVFDVNYIFPTFGYLFVISESINCLKQPYYNLISAAGHYKETQKGAFVEATLNFLLSIIFVNIWGLSGIIFGTIIAGVYRFCDLVLYLKTNILKRNVKKFVIRQIINAFNVILLIVLFNILPIFKVETYFYWMIKATFVFITSGVVTILINYLFYRNDLCLVFRKVFGSIFNTK